MIFVDLLLPRRSFGHDWWFERSTSSLEIEAAYVSAETVHELVWVDDEAAPTYAALGSDNPNTGSVERLSAVGGQTLFETEPDEVEGTVPAILSETEGSFSRAYGTQTGWYCRLNFPDETSRSEFERQCEAVGITPTEHVHWDVQTEHPTDSC
jgi:hypothetical protein